MPGRRVLAAGLVAALIAVVVVTVNRSPRGDLPDASHAAPQVAREAGATHVDESQDTPVVTVPRETVAVSATPTIAEETTPPESSGPRELTDLRESPAFARLLGQPPRPTETRITIDDMQVAVDELPSTNGKVRIYQVSNN